MNENRILDSLKKTIDRAPIDILDKITKEPRTKMLRHDQITAQETKTRSFKKWMPYASIAAVFFIGFFGLYFRGAMPDSKIYLDVNPSIEIVTNKQDRVIEIKTYNREGEIVADGLEYKGKTPDVVAEEIVDRMMREHYLDKEHEFLLLSVYNKNKDKAEIQRRDLDQKIHEYLQEKALEPIILSQNLDNTSTIEKYAKEYGISAGKMTFIRNLIILNPEFRTEDLVDLSIEELVRVSQGMNLELDQIIDSADFDRIRNISPGPGPMPQPETTPKPATQPQSGRISPEQAKQIALAVAAGVITDFDFDEDDMAYEVEIEAGDLEYEITIDAKTGKVIEVGIDD